MALRQGLLPAVVGLTAGLGLSLALTRLLAVSLIACLGPARRAANVDPAIALRYE